MALANLLKGVPIDATMSYVGGFFDLLIPYTLIAGLATLSLFVTHGAIFLNLKSTDPIRARALAAIKRIGPAATVLLLLFVVGHLPLDRRLRAAGLRTRASCRSRAARRAACRRAT